MRPIQVVARIATIVFVAEVALMGAISAFAPDLSPLTAVLLDSALLTCLSAIAIWAWVIRPYASARDHSADALTAQGERLREEIAQREAAEARLRPLSVAIANIPTSVVITNTAGVITWVNRRFVEVTGYQPQEVIGQNARIQKSGETPHETYVDMWRVIAAGESWHGEFVNRRRDGSLYWESAFISPIVDDHGVVRSYVAVKLDITAEKQREQILIDQASTDPLTGAANRRSFATHAAQRFGTANPGNGAISVLMLDIDHFKRINDKHGHAVGDLVLKRVVQQAGELLRTDDLLARIGGEEFAVLLPNTTLEQAANVADRLRQRLAEQRVPGGDDGIRFTVSIGVAARQAGEPTVDTVLGRADAAMYRAKAEGRDRIVVASGSEVPVVASA